MPSLSPIRADECAVSCVHEGILLRVGDARCCLCWLATTCEDYCMAHLMVLVQFCLHLDGISSLSTAADLVAKTGFQAIPGAGLAITPGGGWKPGTGGNRGQTGRFLIF